MRSFSSQPCCHCGQSLRAPPVAEPASRVWRSGRKTRGKVRSTRCVFRAPQEGILRCAVAISITTAVNCFYPLFCNQKRGKRKVLGRPQTPFYCLSRLLPQTGFPNKDNRALGKKSERRKLCYRAKHKAHLSFPVLPHQSHTVSHVLFLSYPSARSALPDLTVS